MIKRSSTLACAISFLLLFSGCATTWSDRDKAQLASVSVSPVQGGKEAYKKSDAKDSPGMANSLPVAMGGGMLPSLLGSAIDATVTARQQKKFEATNVQHFEALAGRMASPPTAELGSAIKQALTAHGFFGPRLAETSAATFTTEIISYGLQKSPLSQKDDILLRVRIIARISLLLPDKRALWTAQITGVASAAKHANEILEDSDFIAQGIQDAAGDFGEQVIEQLGLKITPRK